MVLFRHLKSRAIDAENVTKYLVLGSTPVFVYAVLQRALPLRFPHTFSLDISDTFQSGNHLSFYAGLILILSIAALSEKTNHHEGILKSRKLYFLTLPLAGFAMHIGTGRTAIITLFISAICVFLFFIAKSASERESAVFSCNNLTVFALFTIFAYLFFSLFQNLLKLGFHYFFQLISYFSIHKLIAMGERKDMYHEAWHALSQKWLIGLGDDSFFSL